MAINAPEQVSDGTDRGPVYWTQFPASAVHADWSDPAAAHHAIMRLFPATLPGAADKRRMSAGILFRIDNVGGVPTVLVQSTVPPEMVPIEGRTMTVTGRGWDNQPGDLIAMRVAVNPVLRGKQARPDGTKRDVTRGVVGPRDISEWLAARIGDAVTEIEIVSHFRDTYRTGDRDRRRSLVIDTIDALAVVIDSVALDQHRRLGIGRSRAYGCGLMTARPATRD